MIRYTPFVAFLLVLSGCGGSPKTSIQSTVITIASDPRLRALWSHPCEPTVADCGAVQAIATQSFDLKAALPGQHDWRPADPRANDVSPDGLTITVDPDMTEIELRAQGFTGTVLQPSGIIPAPQNEGGARWCHSYLLGSRIVVAQSLLYSAGATGWEMQNFILVTLEYDASGRRKGSYAETK